MRVLADLSNTMRRAHRRRHLVLSVLQSVAETWPAPRLVRLSADDLSASLEIRVEDDPIDFARDKVDMRIFYGHDLYGEYRVEKLYSDVMVAVASPDFVSDNGHVSELIADKDMIHTDWARDYSTSPNWSKVITGDRIVDHNVGLRVQASSTALSFSRQGFGVALLPKRFADEDLASGRVVQMTMEPVQMTHEYLIAYRKTLAASPGLRAVVEVLAT
jgi:LysR family glycine cleavage system transcriptional activator